MSTRYHLYKSMFPTLGMAFLLNACGATVNWNYPRVRQMPSHIRRPPPSARCFRKRLTNIRDYPASALFGKAVTRSWPGWRWPT